MAKRISQEKKTQKGTSRGVRNKSVKRQDVVGYPDPGVEITESQMKIYQRICDHLQAYSALVDVDCYIIASMSVAIDTRNEAIKLMVAEGLIQEFENGTRNISPEFSIFKKANEEIRQLSKFLGMDPRSRSSIPSFLDAPTGKEDPIETLLKRAS